MVCGEDDFYFSEGFNRSMRIQYIALFSILISIFFYFWLFSNIAESAINANKCLVIRFNEVKSGSNGK